MRARIGRALSAILPILAGCTALACAAGNAFAGPAAAPSAGPSRAPATVPSPPSASAPAPTLAEASGALLEPQAVLFDPFLSELEERTFHYFWETANPKNGLIPDRYPTPSFASIAAVGFGLTAYPIGVERHYVTRAEARDRVLATLRFFQHAPNEHGFFYHFLDMRSGARANDSEVSTVDTSLLIAGVLLCESYFDTPDPGDVEIRGLADRIYRRVDWTWAQPRPPAIALAWTPESGFSSEDWRGYNEAMLVYLLALGSPTHPISQEAWKLWTSTYNDHWGTFYHLTYLGFAPLFGYQYTHVWVDFRGIQDAYMRAHDLNYFENSRRATYAQRRYAMADPMDWQGYGRNVWGLSASDGPGPAQERYRGKQLSFLKYAARGAAVGSTIDDGTIAPTAAIGSLPFAPEIVLPAMLEMYHRFGASIYSTYGFKDAFNESFRALPSDTVQPGRPGWVDPDYVAIDQGPILAMIENYRSRLIWRVMHGNRYLRRGLERAGFTGGWLSQVQTLTVERGELDALDNAAAVDHSAAVAGNGPRARAAAGGPDP
jgi:hypothetical protein